MTDADTPVVEDAPTADEVPERPMPSSPGVAALLEGFDDATFTEHTYASSSVMYTVVSVPVDAWVDFAEAAREAGFDMFIDIAAVDHYTEKPRYEVSCNLLSMTTRERVIMSTRVPYDDPTVPSLTGVFAGANFYEREAYDLFGIDFPGHPDLTRILLPDDWEGHPLRKDYDVGAIPVEFKAGSENL